MIATWVYVVCGLTVVFSLGVFVGALVGYPGDRHGGTVDLSRGAARGELDLDWADPRTHPLPGGIRPGLGSGHTSRVDWYLVGPGGVADITSVRSADEPERRPSFGV